MAEEAAIIENPSGDQTPLTHQTARGFAWNVGQTFVAKIAAMAANIILARLVMPAEWGIVAQAYALASFPSILRDAGMQSILVQRQRKFKRWVNPVFWMSLCAGAGAGMILLFVAPLYQMFQADGAAAGFFGLKWAITHPMAPASHPFGGDVMSGLVAWLAVGSVFIAAATVPNAVLQIRLRFQLLAILNFSFALCTAGLSVLMAWAHYGAYSFIVPIVLVNVLRCVWFWGTARCRVRMRLYPRRWRFLFTDSGVLLLTSLFSMIIASGDYLILGALKGKVQAGYLYFAFNLSFQTLILLSVNLSPILFPALARLSAEPKRQAQAYIRALQVLALIGAPACFLQAALVEPGFKLLFKPNWDPAIAITQYLSLAMAVRVVGTTITNFTNAQGRFKLQCLLSGISCVLFVMSVAVAACFGGAREVAATESIFFVIVESAVLGIVLGANGFSALRELAKIFAAPLAMAAIAVGAACAAGMLVPMTGKTECLARIALITGVSALVYLPLIRLTAPQPWKEIAELVGRMLNRGKRKPAAP